MAKDGEFELTFFAIHHHHMSVNAIKFPIYVVFVVIEVIDFILLHNYRSSPQQYPPSGGGLFRDNFFAGKVDFFQFMTGR